MAVELHHVPNWLRLRLLDAFGCKDGDTSGSAVLYHSIASCGGDSSWLDHWGTEKNGQDCFISEPYLNWPPPHEAMRVPNKISNATNCELILSPDAEWNPHAIRLLFVPRKN